VFTRTLPEHQKSPAVVNVLKLLDRRPIHHRLYGEICSETILQMIDLMEIYTNVSGDRSLNLEHLVTAMLDIVQFDLAIDLFSEWYSCPHSGSPDLGLPLQKAWLFWRVQKTLSTSAFIFKYEFSVREDSGPRLADRAHVHLLKAAGVTIPESNMFLLRLYLLEEKGMLAWAWAAWLFFELKYRGTSGDKTLRTVLENFPGDKFDEFFKGEPDFSSTLEFMLDAYSENEFGTISAAQMSVLQETVYRLERSVGPSVSSTRADGPRGSATAAAEASCSDMADAGTSFLTDAAAGPSGSPRAFTSSSSSSSSVILQSPQSSRGVAEYEIESAKYKTKKRKM